MAPFGRTATRSIHWLYDFAFLSFSGTMGVFLIGSLVWMVAILLDENRVFPKWFGYLNLCNALTEVVVAPAWIFQRGAFAWNGAIAWWINMVVFVLYTGVFIMLLRKMIDARTSVPDRYPTFRVRVCLRPDSAEAVR